MGFFGRLFGGEGYKHASHSSSNTSTIAKDPVCGMDVDVNTFPARSEYEGKPYFFCALACKTQFDKDPAKFVAKQGNGGHHHGHGCC